MYTKFNNEYYKQKVICFLHDPIEKFENIQGHREVAQENINILYRKILLSKEELENIYRQADQIASALSRIILKHSSDTGRSRIIVDYKEAEYIDIFSLEKKYLNSEQYGEKIISDEEKKFFRDFLSILSNLKVENEYELEKIRFWLLWRITPEIFKNIDIIPADTRAPNHSIYDHLVQTSCIMGSLYDGSYPGFLLVSISPVQEFISKARKTADLWAGSYILSYLTFRLIIKIADLFGPDHIIFPNLLRQPLVDYYILKKYPEILKQLKIDPNSYIQKIIKTKLEENLKPEKLLIANIPNRFLSIIPINNTKNIDNNSSGILCLIQEEMLKALQEISKSLVDTLKNVYPIKNLQNNIQNLVFQNLTSYFQLYSVILPWPSERDIQSALKDYENLNSNYKDRNTYNVIKGILENPSYKTGKPGVLYSILLEMAEKLLGSRKTIRNTINGNMLVSDKDKCSLCGDFSGILEVGSENLCGLCLVKRFFREIIQNELNSAGIDIPTFPSTSEISSTTSKIIIYSNQQILRKIQDFSEKLHQKLSTSISNFYPYTDPVPKIKKELGIKKQHNLEGQWLMEENYTSRKIKSEYGIEESQELLDKFKSEIKEILKDINVPRYYGLLMMDGDNIGAWLKGDNNPPIRRILHSKVVKELEKHPEVLQILDKAHPNSPSIHQAFSRRLSIFAIQKVKEIVEDECYGKVIYAGGDDILAILPLSHVIICAYKLNQAFVDTLRSKNKIVDGNTISPASTSAGIVMLHYKYPLYLAFEELRETEKIAKGKFNKDSLSLKLIKHSGEMIISGIKWKNFEIMYKLFEKFEYVPSSFVYDLAEFTNTFCIKHPGDLEIFLSQMKILFNKKTNNKHFFEIIKDLFDSYVKSEIPGLCLDEKVRYFVNMLLIFRFIFPQVRKVDF
ncbi:MAG: type III-B CRISPR-associated protein Cas10/Cmr2 [Candidatus Calescibacterium sp.]|nr:type III-B CRISPR-associated protein Cas10/Cmr2 [Candidatus Calescibacterium sp.]MDW8133295.1 type III-B CRISPR-associated protein Cas10/Cmr2 [Candidatus Calescibacterium sp.]